MLSGATGKLALRISVEFCPSGFTGARVPGAFALGFCNVKGRHNCIQITGWGGFMKGLKTLENKILEIN